MAYEKQTWEAREGVGLNKFTDQLTGTVLELTSTPDSVTTPGSPFSVERMNHMEQGIFDATEMAEQALTGAAQQYVRNRPPVETDDVAAGVMPGHTWIVPQIQFNNLVPNAATPNAAAWTLSNGSLASSGTAVLLTAANGLAYSTATLSTGAQAVPGNTLYFAGILCAQSSGATSVSVTLEDDAGNSETLVQASPTAGTEYALDTLFVVPDTWSGTMKIRLRLDYSSASTINGKTATLDAPYLLDLTADMGSGLEFTQEEAAEYLAQFSPVFQSENYEYSGYYWVCDNNAEGAAHWWRIAGIDDAPTANVTINTIPGAAVTMSKDGVVITATAGDNGVATLYPAKLGEWAITVTSATQTYEGSISIEVIGFVETSFPSFSQISWADFDIVSQSGAAATVFAEAYENEEARTITLSTGEEVDIRIEDFDHDTLTAGGTAGVTLSMVNLLATTANMNSSNTNVGGWNSSAMRTRMSTYLSQLPADLQAVIKPVNKVTTSGNQATTTTTTSDELWLFSAKEVGLYTTTAGYSSEGETYPLFVDNDSRIKKLSNGTGSADYWWTRSPHTGSATYFVCVNTSGAAGSTGASGSYGVCFGLCV